MEDKNGPQNHQQKSTIETVSKFFEQNLQQIADTNTTINRFLSAFIDHVIQICFTTIPLSLKMQTILFNAN